MNLGKCGHCGASLARGVLIESIEAKVGLMASGGAYNAVSYSCPSCHAVLGVQMDPVALNTDLLNALQKER